MSSKLRSIFIGLFLCLMSCFAWAWQGEVIKVADGDTITVMNGHRQVRIRFYGIDTPEKRQAFGKAAKRHLASIVARRTVDIEPVAKDRYGRIVALVYLNGQNINERMVKDGYAWVYRRYCKKSFCRQWLVYEAKARERKIGLWQDPHSVPPWKWRHRRKRSIFFSPVGIR